MTRKSDLPFLSHAAYVFAKLIVLEKVTLISRLLMIFAPRQILFGL